MMTEEWIRWNPIEGLAAKYDIESITYGKRGLTLFLSHHNYQEQALRVTFSSLIGAYRYVNESYRTELLHELKQRYGPDFYGTWTFFQVHHSRYAEWLAKESSEISMYTTKFIHFSFISTDAIVDVLAEQQAKFDFTQGVYNYDRRMDTVETDRWVSCKI